jgi:hypothetical protein
MSKASTDYWIIDRTYFNALMNGHLEDDEPVDVGGVGAYVESGEWQGFKWIKGE